MKSTVRRFAAWLACFAILFAALAPSISHAMAAAGGEPGSEICSVGGRKFLQASDQDTGSKSDQLKSSHLKCCSFCPPHTGSFAALPVNGLTVPLLDGATMHPALFYHAPRTLFIWSSAQSRAPPAQA